MFRRKTPDRPQGPEPKVKIKYSVWDKNLRTHAIWLTCEVPLSKAKQLRAEVALAITQLERSGDQGHVNVRVSNHGDPYFYADLGMSLDDAKNMRDRLEMDILHAEAAQ